jgi:hypothetical protein
MAFRKKIYRSIDELQTDLDVWIRIQRATVPSGPLVLWQNPDSDLSWRTPTGKGKTHGGMTTGDNQSVQTANTVCPINSQLMQVSGISA